MIVSQFELLVKRIAPTAGLPPAVSAAFRRIVQGYFLNITNLENRTVNLRFRVTIPAPGAPAIDREIVLAPTPNVAMTFDNAPTNNQPLTLSLVTTTPSVKVFSTPALSPFPGPLPATGGIRIGPLQTVSVKLLPSTAGPILASANLEIRGFVELVQTRRFPFLEVPPAMLLTTPEIRGTVLDNAYPSADAADELDFDQISYSLPTASGKVQNQVEGLPGLVLESLSANVRTLLAKPMHELSEDDIAVIEDEMSRME